MPPIRFILFGIFQAAEEIKRLYDLFIAVDATQVEINPFVETHDGRVFCVDAKMNFDDSAAFRQKEIFAMEDYSEQVKQSSIVLKRNYAIFSNELIQKL